MNKIDDILERLKAAEQPIVGNPDELTDLIMSNLPEQGTSKKEQAKKPHVILVALRAISSIAAVWLIGLFLYTNYPQESNSITQQSQTIDMLQGSTLKDVYISRLRASQEKSISYTQLKNMRYE